MATREYDIAMAGLAASFQSLDGYGLNGSATGSVPRDETRDETVALVNALGGRNAPGSADVDSGFGRGYGGIYRQEGTMVGGAMSSASAAAKKAAEPPPATQADLDALKKTVRGISSRVTSIQTQIAGLMPRVATYPAKAMSMTEAAMLAGSIRKDINRGHLVVIATSKCPACQAMRREIESIQDVVPQGSSISIILIDGEMSKERPNPYTAEAAGVIMAQLDIAAPSAVPSNYVRDAGKIQFSKWQDGAMPASMIMNKLRSIVELPMSQQQAEEKKSKK